MDPADLYAVPLDEFTAERDRLAKELRSRGEDESARRVKAMRKPSLPAWAVNRLAREDNDELARWFELRDELGGASDAAELRRLATQRRRLLADLLKRAEDILRGAGHAVTATTTDAISKTLQAGGEQEDRRRIEEGTLERPLTPTGFEGLGGFESAAIDSEPQPARPSASARKAAERLSSEAEAAERKAQELARAAAKAARAAEDLAREAEQASRRAERARKKADEAIDALSG